MQLYTVSLYNAILEQFRQIQDAKGFDLTGLASRMTSLQYGQQTNLGFTSDNQSIYSELSKTHVNILVTHPTLDKLDDDELKAVISTVSIFSSWCILMVKRAYGAKHVFTGLEAGCAMVKMQKALHLSYRIHKDATPAHIALFSTFLAHSVNTTLMNLLAEYSPTELIKQCGVIRADIEVLTSEDKG